MGFNLDRFQLEKIKEQYEKEKENIPELMRMFFEMSIAIVEEAVSKKEELELHQLQAKQQFEEAIQGKLEKIPPPQIKVKIGQSWQTIKYNKELNIWYIPVKKEDSWGETIGNIIIFPDDKAFIVAKEHILKVAPIAINASSGEIREGK